MSQCETLGLGGPGRIGSTGDNLRASQLLAGKWRAFGWALAPAISDASTARVSTMRFLPRMNSPTSPSPQLFFDTINAYQKTGALKAGIELGLFTKIGSAPATAAELAQRCGCPERGIRILSDYLAIIGFLIKENGRYALTPESAAFLDQTSPAYVGGAAEFLLHPELMEHYYHLADTIRLGRLKLSEQGTTAPDHPVWESFARAMGAMMTPCARGAAELAPLPADRESKVLDIAASHGMYGIAFAQKNLRTHLVALDWQNVLPLTEENARKHGVGDRFSSIAGDAFKVDLGSGYDIVLVPNFLHHFTKEDCTTFLRRAHAALRPGGRVLIVEFVPNDDRVTPPGAAMFSMVMLGSTPGGDAYTFAEYRQMLADAGFVEPTWHPLPPTAQSAVIAQRPS